MKISIPVILLLLTTFVIFLLTIILDIVQRKKIQKQNCLTVSHHFIGSWEYFDSHENVYLNLISIRRIISYLMVALST